MRIGSGGTGGEGMGDRSEREPPHGIAAVRLPQRDYRNGLLTNRDRASRMKG